MAQVIILGTAAAVPTVERDYSHIAVHAGDKLILVDCGSNPMIGLAKMGLDWHQLEDIIATHFHADHIASLPNLIVGMWLSGREKPLSIYSLEPTLQKIRRLLDLFEWQNWPGLFPINFHEIPSYANTIIIDTDDLQVTSTPTAHSVPSIGLRFDSKKSKKSVVFSSDTKPSENLIDLARGTQVLIHEATGDLPGHSSAEQAGKIANLAQTNQLYLIHYPTPHEVDPDVLMADARKTYDGMVTLARDGMRIAF